MKLFAFLLTFVSFVVSLTANTLSVADFGLKPNSDQNATPIVRKAIEQLKKNGGGVLVFPKGTYHFQAEGALVTTDGPYVSNNQDDFPKWTAMPIHNMKHITIDGSGSLFLMHHRMMVFHIKKSEQVTIKNLSIDFVSPINSDSIITAIESDSFTLRFAPGTLYKIDEKGRFRFFIDGKLQSDWGAYAFEGTTGRTKYRKHRFPLRLSRCKAKEISPGLVQFQGKVKPSYRVGDRITHRHNKRNHVGVFIEESKDTKLEHVTIHHACAMGVVGQRSNNITLDYFRMEPRKGSGRISTAMADATHFSGCRGLIKVTHSFFQGMMDDAINVHGTSLRIVKIDREKNALIVQFMHGMSKGFTIASAGDKIRLIDNETLLTVGKELSTVKTARAIDGNKVEITFVSSLPEALKVHHAIENITYTPEVLFSGNTVKNNRARGMLFNTPRKCVVENNYVSTSGSAVLVAGDANGWYESGAVGEMGPTIIRNNRFEDCLTNMYQFCRAVISIDPVIKKLNPRQSYHRDIRIENNHFKIFDAPLVYARSVDGLSIVGNTFERTHTFQPWHPNKWAFLFEGCQHVTIEKNQIKGTLLSTSVKLHAMSEKQLSLGEKSPFTLE